MSVRKAKNAPQDDGNLIEVASQTKSEPLTRLQVAELVIGAAAAIGAVIYALLQGLYIEFYDDFGVRPEEVGMDRIAILSRAAWVAFAFLVGFVIFVLFRDTLGRSRLSRCMSNILRILSVLVVIATLWAYKEIYSATEGLSEKVMQGQSVSGLKIPVPLLNSSIPILDVRAHPAEVTWLDPKTEQQLGSGGEKLIPAQGLAVMYIGRSDKVAAFYTQKCSTVLLPSDSLRITLLDQGPKLRAENKQLGWDPNRDCPSR